MGLYIRTEAYCTVLTEASCSRWARHDTTYLDTSGFVGVCRDMSGFVGICRGLSGFVRVCRGFSGFVEPGGYMRPS